MLSSLLRSVLFLCRWIQLHPRDARPASGADPAGGAALPRLAVLRGDSAAAVHRSKEDLTLELALVGLIFLGHLGLAECSIPSLVEGLKV